ncbi:fimbrial chaperone [Citrobacter freundii]|uniref:Fimbrial chaperone n=1 Tax=Citrobacter portucalensis TaxID=1639133 RepID=A0A9X4JL85_9ENTR|nr:MULTISPECIES: fimbrial chaperone [Citrobacter freundii complex]MDE9617641.1 fimbrial chaperone [Citrobacter portucalensis]QLR79017.1 fimbrial chaperone [Citrobacter freundii]
MLRHLKTTFAILALAGSLFSTQSWADIVISGTRIIYHGEKNDVSVRLENKGTRPLLVQNWIDTGNDNVEPGTIKVPFNATPPVSRVEPQKGQTVKIMFTGAQKLPADRESVFWFNVLEVPPKADNKEAKSILQLAFRTRIKLFYRPQGIPDDASSAASKLKWSVKTVQGKAVLQASNPTPYFVSFNSCELNVGGKKYPVEAGMAEPLTQTTFNVKGLTGAVSAGNINYTSINDFGGITNGTASL